MSSPRGYSLPLSPGGTASLVPAPPWHYVGDFLVIEYWAEPAAVAAVLPAGPRAVRRGSRPVRRALRRLAVVLRLGRGAGRSGARAVQGVLRRRERAPRRRARDDLPVHLGRHATSPSCAGGSRASRRSSAQIEMTRVVRPRLPGRGADVRRRVLGARPAARPGHGHARARLGVGADSTTTRRS